MTRQDHAAMDHEFNERMNHIRSIVAEMEQCKTGEDVIVCQTCRNFRVVRKGIDCDCPTCKAVRGIGETI